MTIPFWTERGTIDLAALRPQDLTAEILGNAMAKINRFGGRTPEPWSVAAHAVLVERLCPAELGPWALLHDASTAFLGEMMSPALELVCRAGTRSAVEHAVRNARDRLDRTIGTAWGVVVRSRSKQLLEADRIAVQAEALVLLGTRPEFLPADKEDDFDRAVSWIRDHWPRRDWRDAAESWRACVGQYASVGMLTLPKQPEPSGIMPAA